MSFQYFNLWRGTQRTLGAKIVRQKIACVQRAAYWRWAGFLALNLIRRTKVEFCTSVDTKPFSPPIANTMLAVRSFLSFSVNIQCQLLCHTYARHISQYFRHREKLSTRSRQKKLPFGLVHIL